GGADADDLVDPLADDGARDDLARRLLAARDGDPVGRRGDAVDALRDDATLTAREGVVLLLDGLVRVGLAHVLVHRVHGGDLDVHPGADGGDQRGGGAGVVVKEDARLGEELTDRAGLGGEVLGRAVDDELDGDAVDRCPRLEPGGGERGAVDLRGLAGPEGGGGERVGDGPGVGGGRGAGEGDGAAGDDGEDEGVEAAAGDGSDVLRGRGHLTVACAAEGVWHYRVLSGGRAPGTVSRAGW